MRCETFRNRLALLDAGRGPGLFARAHLSRCAACRAYAELEAAALASYRAPSPALPGLEDRIMAAVRLTPRPRRRVSLRDWVGVGLLIAVSTALIPLAEEFDWVKELFGPSYALPLSLVLALVLTAYVAVFIGSHMTELLEFLERRLGYAVTHRA